MSNMKSLLLKTFGILLALSAVLAVSAASVFAVADAYPSKPLRLIISFAPGGSNDIIGRLIATGLSERLGQQVVVENRAGAGGIIGSEVVAKARPDGYTLLLSAISHTIQPALQKLPYDPVKSYAFIAKMGSGIYSLVVHSSVPANSVKEFIAFLKQKPGELIFSSSGSGGDVHLLGELFKAKTGTDFKIVQFKGGGPAVIDLVGGHSHFSFRSPPPMIPYLKSGKLRVLATTGLKRSFFMPDVPTMAEAGVPGYIAGNWWGIVAPAGTPAPIVDKLSNEIKTIMASEKIKQVFKNEGAEVDYLGPAEFGLFFAGEIARWGKVVKDANMKLEEAI